MLKAGLGLETSIIFIQKLFLQNCSFAYVGFNLYRLFRTDNQRDKQVLIVVKKDILNRVIIDNQIDLISHLYYFCSNIQEINLKFGKILRKTKIVNLYNKKVG